MGVEQTVSVQYGFRITNESEQKAFIKSMRKLLCSKTGKSKSDYYSKEDKDNLLQEANEFFYKDFSKFYPLLEFTGGAIEPMVSQDSYQMISIKKSVIRVEQYESAFQDLSDHLDVDGLMQFVELTKELNLPFETKDGWSFFSYIY